MFLIVVLGFAKCADFLKGNNWSCALSPVWSCPESQGRDCWRCSEPEWSHRTAQLLHLNTNTYVNANIKTHFFFRSSKEFKNHCEKGKIRFATVDKWQKSAIKCFYSTRLCSLTPCVTRSIIPMNAANIPFILTRAQNVLLYIIWTKAINCFSFNDSELQC